MSKKDIDLNKEGEEIKETPEAAELKDDAEVKNSDAVSTETAKIRRKSPKERRKAV